MGIIESMRKQTAVFWGLTGYDSAGEPEYAAPVEIRCRWEDNQDVQGLSEVMRTKVTVYVDRDMRTGDHLMLGTLDSGTSDDPRDEESYEVTHFTSTPNLKARKFLRTANGVASPLKLLALHGRGVEAVTYKRVTASAVSSGGVLTETIASDISVLSAARSQLQADDQGGRYRATDVAWDVSKKYLPFEPGMKGDRIVDAFGVRWDAIGYSENRLLRGWWRIVTRRAS